MSSVVSEQAKLSWLTRVQRSLLVCPASFACWTPRAEMDEYLFVTQVANELMGHVKIWVVEACEDILAHIACWHCQIETYRGHLLCSNDAGQTFLIDLQSWRYVKSAATQLLQIDGVDQARRFVDALWEHRSGKGGEHAASR